MKNLRVLWCIIAHRKYWVSNATATTLRTRNEVTCSKCKREWTVGGDE